MAGSLLLPNVGVSRAENPPSQQVAGSSKRGQEQTSFEKVQQELSRAERPAPRNSADDPSANATQAETGPEPAGKAAHEEDGPETDESAALADSKQRQPDSQGEAPAGVAGPEAAVALEDLIGTGDTDAFALVAPITDPLTRGNNLPLATRSGEAATGGPAPLALSASQAGGPTAAVGLRQMFLQLAQGGGSGGDGATGPGAAANGVVEADLQSFKASLAEAIDGRGSRAPDTTPVSLSTGPRGLEVREGSALIRQYSTTVDTPVQQGDWGDKMAGKISWLANQQISLAEIHVNPPDLGPVEVRVSVQNDQASVAVHAQNASVRDLLELSSHRLREMLQENGMNLAKMDVSDQSARQQQQTGENGNQGDAPGGSDRDSDGDMVSLDGEAVSTGEIHMQWQNQVDLYA